VQMPRPWQWPAQCFLRINIPIMAWRAPFLASLNVVSHPSLELCCYFGEVPKTNNLPTLLPKRTGGGRGSRPRKQPQRGQRSSPAPRRRGSRTPRTQPSPRRLGGTLLQPLAEAVLEGCVILEAAALRTRRAADLSDLGIQEAHRWRTTSAQPRLCSECGGRSLEALGREHRQRRRSAIRKHFLS
jgi:hypothetical protein